MTEQHAELSTKLVTGHKRDGRCKYSKQGKRELVEACLKPGVSVAGMALRHGVNANLLRKWILAYQDATQGGIPAAPPVEPVAAAQLLPLLADPSPDEIAGEGADAKRGSIDIIVAAFTVRMHGVVNPRQLAAVLDCLAQHDSPAQRR